MDSAPTTWSHVCAWDDLLPGRGVAAWLGNRAVAIVRVGDDVHAVDNRDPFTGVSVLSRGLVAQRGDRIAIVSPLHKQAFDLVTGECLDDPAIVLDVFPVRVIDGVVEVEHPVATAVADVA